MQVLPIWASAGITGFESPAAEYSQLALSLDEILVAHPSATWVGLACGSSMQGVGIFDQDVLVVDRHVERRDVELVVANLNGEFVCKLLDAKQRLLLSASPEHAPVAINEYDTFSVEGVVITSARRHYPLPLPACLR